MSRRTIGRIRSKLPDAMIAAMKDAGYQCRAEADEQRPAMGHWRTDFRADVYRWEGSLRWSEDGEHWYDGASASWDTMTDCVRHGMTVQRDLGHFEFHAKKSRIHPVNFKAGRAAIQTPGATHD